MPKLLDLHSEKHSAPDSAMPTLPDPPSILYSTARLFSARTDLRRLLVQEPDLWRSVAQARSSLPDNETSRSPELAVHRRRSELRYNLYQQTSYSQSMPRCSRCRETRERKSRPKETRDAGRATRRRASLTPATSDRDLLQTSRTIPSCKPLDSVGNPQK